MTGIGLPYEAQHRLCWSKTQHREYTRNDKASRLGKGRAVVELTGSASPDPS